ncbi:hypothetical protein HDU85_002803 [Gaertneriomyces sp. JEL0708]|nr:hypothetical protein HDU85_002803 [Gaertneriomyces sp. JEL0708]
MGNLVNPMNGVLLVAVILAAAVKDYAQAAVVLGVITVNGTIGFLQEYKSEKTMAALRSLASPTARVLRDGELKTVPSNQVCPGDVVMIEEGDQVPADLRLFEAVNLEIDEMLLTGESLPVRKTVAPITGSLHAVTTHATETPLEGVEMTSLSSPVVNDDDVPVGDRTNLAFSSTVVLRGRGKGIVYATGLQTQVGAIADLLNGAGLKNRNAETTTANADAGSAKWHERLKNSPSFKRFKKLTGWGEEGDGRTPLQRSMDRMMLVLLAGAVATTLIIFATFNFDIDATVVLYAMTVAIAIVPEGLPAVITVTLAMGVKAMARQKALVRQLASVEALGMVSNICSDKTGTLTEGRMSVKEAWVAGRIIVVNGSGLDPTAGTIVAEDDGTISTNDVSGTGVLQRFISCLYLCNNATLHPPIEAEETWKAVGDPTEVALRVFAYRFPAIKELIDKSDATFIAEMPFDASIKRMTTVYAIGDRFEVFMKGALESVLAASIGYYDSAGHPVDGLSEAFQQQVENEAARLARAGLRVLAMAHRSSVASTPEKMSGDRTTVERGMYFIGLCGIFDPPRAESAASVKTCHQAGIAVHMATGDHVETAKAISLQIGIIKPGQEHLVCAASTFDRMDDAEIDRMTLPLVLARCSPQTKVKFIQALHRRNKFVAMTGDGTNDAPAIKLADVGISMGLNGSDVAKEASSIVLTDDNFASIVGAVKEGRRLYANIVKFSLCFFAANVAETLMLLLALAVRGGDGIPIFPMSPMQILWINMVASSPVGLTLAMAPSQPSQMLASPRTRSLFTLEFVLDALISGVVIGICGLLCFTLSTIINTDLSSITAEVCNHEGYTLACEEVYRSRAVAFVSLGLLLVLHGWNCSDVRKSAWSTSLAGRDWKRMCAAVCVGIVLVVPVVYIPGVNDKVFKMKGFGWEWGMIAASLLLFIVLMELWKLLKRTRLYTQDEIESTSDVEEMQV